MPVLAMYFPEPQQFVDSVLLLAFVSAVMCWLANRLRLSVPLAAALMLIGSLIALAPAIVRVSQIPVGVFDYARQMSPNDHSDAFLAFTSYLTVGYGKLTAFAGMCVPLFTYAVIAWMRDRGRQSATSNKRARV